MEQTGPTLAGFQNFITTVMGIDSTNLPASNPAINFSFCSAMEIVNLTINAVSPRLYCDAVYNLAGDILINVANDTPSGNYFSNLREKWKLNGFVGGVVQSTSDQGTGDSLTIPESLGHLSLSDLQSLKTPYGRAYLYIAQKYGPNLWGIA